MCAKVFRYDIASLFWNFRPAPRRNQYRAIPCYPAARDGISSGPDPSPGLANTGFLLGYLMFFSLDGYQMTNSFMRRNTPTRSISPSKKFVVGEIERVGSVSPPKFPPIPLLHSNQTKGPKKGIRAALRWVLSEKGPLIRLRPARFVIANGKSASLEKWKKTIPLKVFIYNGRSYKRVGVSGRTIGIMVQRCCGVLITCFYFRNKNQRDVWTANQVFIISMSFFIFSIFYLFWVKKVSMVQEEKIYKEYESLQLDH